ncbi:MAG: penicillin-binding transpeptidase domain-containing protein, partial [Syntrophales bacterium]|nr:penicillin-binding transpeptidase domain-containing protein [Syntrophales bacterium]
MKRNARQWLRFRIFSLWGLFVVLFIALFTRALHLQVISGNALKNLAAKQHNKVIYIPPERGIIFDRNGEKLAASIMTDSVCADPAKLRNPRAAAAKLAAILDMDEGSIMKKMESHRHFCWIARRIPAEQAARVEALNMDGIFLIKEPQRHYPNGELAGHLIGFVGADAVGLEGLELKYDPYLKGSPERLVWARDARQKRLYPRVEKASAEGKPSYHLILTIDSRIQHLVETHLKAAVQEKGAKGGYAVVMDPRTGEILAMANQPSFDPNNFAKGNPMLGKNRVITDCYDPGSTFKPFVAAAALEEKLFKETDRIYCENGHYAIADRVIHEAQRKRHGYLTFREVIKYSSNIGSVKIAERLGKERLYHYITKFGFGAKTNIDLPGEIAGLLRPYRDWTRVDAATIAFGQGVSVTAIQLVTALSAIANSGVLMKPYVIKGIVDHRGQIISENKPTVVRQVISPETAKRMAAIMATVVDDEDGTGKKARIEQVKVAGKTGTSQKF